MPLLTPADFTWNGKEVMSMSEAIMEDFLAKPELSALHTFRTGIKAKQQIAFLGKLNGLIGKSRKNCDTTVDTNDTTGTEKFWDPCTVGFRFEECWADWLETFFVWGLNNGLQKENLDRTDAFNYIESVLKDAAMEANLRMVWFNNTDAANVDDSPAGVITSGLNLSYFNCSDGFWQQIFDIVTANSARRAGTIAKNNGLTYALQAFDTTDTTNKVAHGYLRALLTNADFRLRGNPNKVIMVTQSIYDQYLLELESYTSVEGSFRLLQDGTRSLTFRGVPVIPVDFWDRMILANENYGTHLHLPHRGLLTVKENLVIGVEEVANLSEVGFFYDPYHRLNVFSGLWNLDQKVLKDYMIEVIY